MDHQEGAAGYLSLSAREEDNRSSAGRHAEHLSGDFVTVLLEAVVDGDAFEHVAARRVDIDGDVTLADGSQCCIDSLQRYALAIPVLTDDAVYGDGVRGVLDGRLDRGIPFIERAWAHLAA
ncbi:hypothetical protein D3C77_560230 [compost metagenome]